MTSDDTLAPIEMHVTSVYGPTDYVGLSPAKHTPFISTTYLFV